MQRETKEVSGEDQVLISTHAILSEDADVIGRCLMLNTQKNAFSLSKEICSKEHMKRIRHMHNC